MASTEKIDQELDLEYEALSDRYKIFVNEYLKHRDKSKAARKCGCPAKTARQAGYNTYNRPEVKAYLDRKLRESRSTTDEVIRGLDDMVTFTMSKYMKRVQVVETPKLTVPIGEYIKNLENIVDEENEFMFTAPLNELEILSVQEKIRKLEIELSRLRIEFNRNPLATKIMNGQPQLVWREVPDIKKMVKDKVPLRKVTYRKDGTVEVEGYSAIEASEKLLRLDSAYAEEDKRKAAKNIINLGKVSDAALDELLNAGNETQD